MTGAPGPKAMIDLPEPIFDLYALALPRGHDFGEDRPVEAFLTEDGRAFGIVLEHTDGAFGAIVMRRREDDVLMVTANLPRQGDQKLARAAAQRAMRDGEPPEPLPAGVKRRAKLSDLQGREPGDAFKVLCNTSHRVAAWVLNQLYLALPDPDRNWAGDCQTQNFHTRIWEAHLLASFREQGLLVTQPYEAPDFRIENDRGAAAWVEAVTANPAEPYPHVNSPRSNAPTELEERIFGPAAVRFAKTLGNKLEKEYETRAHVADHPFVIALADFHASGSMVWSREALVGYLYGFSAKAIEVDGRKVAQAEFRDYLLGPSKFRAGLFRGDHCPQLSAVIFTNTCSISKFNRVGITMGMPTPGRRYVRRGELFDRTEGATKGIPFSLDITSKAYREFWPQGYEPWSADLEVLHNPFARHPLPMDLVPDAVHWFEQAGEIVCTSPYETSILWSETLILPEDAPIPPINGKPPET